MGILYILAANVIFVCVFINLIHFSILLLKLLSKICPKTPLNTHIFAPVVTDPIFFMSLLDEMLLNQTFTPLLVTQF